MVSNMPQRQRVLIIGSSSSTGIELVRALSEEKASRRPVIFALCRKTSELDQATKARCNRVIEGDYKQEDDIARAMKKSKADTVIFAPKDNFFSVPFSSDAQTALEIVLQRPEYCHVRLFSLSQRDSLSTADSTTQPRYGQHQLAATIPPEGHKRKNSAPVLKDALEGLSELWSAMQFINCSNAAPKFLDDSETTSSSFAKPWKKGRNIVAPLVTKSIMDMVDDAERDCPPASMTFDSDFSSPLSTSVHLKVNRKNFVEFVVGAVLDRGSSTSINSYGLARGILVTAE
jgi:hypothetical protein